ncbi:hypothetical protein K431DRAFT_248358 [Polychaeton citri CBS 116435]|uniref:Uncharacterized protein n=1 Tax=Polychaeton citri CBS 116435 TaxID=1314669 RepID=A0A9P4Q9R1_9PEZI|nr:hypothetical protein K431DRAFT_248358 [Polychaeton citri CBS 116435]
MSSITPSARTWTLRFKNHRSTVLLHCEPLQRLGSIKEDLLKAIQQSHPDGTINGLQIPDSAEAIMLARPIDVSDLSLGWEPLEKTNNDDFFGDEPVSGKGKGKATASKSKSKGKENTKDSPESLGLKDGGVVAFKFSTAADHSVGTTELDDEDTVLVQNDGDGETWDVVVPTMAETYGEDEGLDAE